MEVEAQVSKYQLLRPGSVTPVLLGNCVILHVDFRAKNTHVADAPEEIFFAELTVAHGTQVYSVMLCVSLGPIDSISAWREVTLGPGRRFFDFIFIDSSPAISVSSSSMSLSSLTISSSLAVNIILILKIS